MGDQEPNVVNQEVLVKKAQAVREALIEVMGENRAEIVKRARAKLTAMGIDVSDEEVEV
jgi:hypothetical protein